MGHTAQTELLPAAQVARETPVQQSDNGIFYATFGDHKLSPRSWNRSFAPCPKP